MFGHISDTHLDGGERALARTRRVMDYVRGLRLDAILVTGDIADHGRYDEYEQAKASLTDDVPVLMLLGNHDDRAAAKATTASLRRMMARCSGPAERDGSARANGAALEVLARDRVHDPARCRRRAGVVESDAMAAADLATLRS